VKSIAERTKEARDALGLSQVDLAARAKVSPGTIGNLEAGTRKSPRELLAIAAALKVSPEWLKSGKGPREAVPSPGAPPRNDVFYSPPAPNLTGPQKLMLELMSELPLDEQGEVIRDLMQRASLRAGEKLLEQKIVLTDYGRDVLAHIPARRVTDTSFVRSPLTHRSRVVEGDDEQGSGS
jgi:transcriptional regulator with XRE-family HTH domain